MWSCGLKRLNDPKIGGFQVVLVQVLSKGGLPSRSLTVRP